MEEKTFFFACVVMVLFFSNSVAYADSVNGKRLDVALGEYALNLLGDAKDFTQDYYEKAKYFGG